MRRAALLQVVVLLMVALLIPMRLAAQSATCPLGYTVVFFNGVGNSYPQAVASTHATQAAIQESQHTTFDVFDAEDVQYQVAYNTTASQQANVFDPVNTTILQDVAEVFVQRAKELDPSGTVDNNFFYMFWEWMGGVPQNYSNAFGNNAATNNFFANFVNAAITVAVGQLAKINGSQAPTESDYADQEAKLTAAANAGRKLLMVAHSQGNLFVNHGYDFILPSGGTTRVKVVHVAPATVTLRGDYELSFNDLVINGLRLVNGFTSIVDPNINPPVTKDDVTGHGYSEIYLSAALVDSLSGQTDRVLLEAEFTAALTAMDQQQCALAISPQSATVKAGAQVTLTAALTPPVNDAELEAITYKWTISGNAGGTFINPVLGNDVTTLITTAPTITYNASSNAAIGQADSVTVEMDVSSANDNNATSKDLADTSKSPAIITVGESNGCYGSATSITNPGSTYSLTVTDVSLGSSGTIQTNYTAKGSVAFADPPYTSTAYEFDTTEVFTYPASTGNNGTSQQATFGSGSDTASWVIYGVTQNNTNSKGVSSQVKGVFTPPVPFGKVTLLVPDGSAISIPYVGTGTTASGSTSVNYTESWQLIGTPTIKVPAGTFKTCAFQVIASNQTNIIDTKWKLYGYGIDVQETTTDLSSGKPIVQDTQRATALSINGERYTGP